MEESQQSAKQPATALLAAGVVLLRDSDVGLEVLVVKRSPDSRVMPLFWVFPGGKVDPQDSSLAHAAARELQEEAGIELKAEVLQPISRFVTPDGLPFRFDTLFFVSRLPAGQSVTIDETEVTESAWMQPSEVIEARNSGQMLIAPPTLVQLMELAGLGSVEEVLAATSGRQHLLD